MTGLERTIALMKSERPNGMLFALAKESMGGNAGREGNTPCVAVNFHFDIQTGEIMCFGNDQDIPAPIRETYQHGYFRIAMGDDRDEIVERHTPFMSPEASKNMELAINWYNMQRQHETRL